jgi:hypothetical protein
MLIAGSLKNKGVIEYDHMLSLVQLIIIISAIVIGGGAILYFYFEADIFMDILKRPLRMISTGMFAIDLAVVLLVFIAYQSTTGGKVDFMGIQLSTIFYALYFAGSLAIIFGARKFTYRPPKLEAFTGAKH